MGSDRTVTPMRGNFEQRTCEGIKHCCAIYCWHYLSDDRAVGKSGLQGTIWVLHCMDLHHHITQSATAPSEKHLKQHKRLRMQITPREGD